MHVRTLGATPYQPIYQEMQAFTARRTPDTPDELQKVTLKEMHWLCDGLSLTPQGAFEERHPKIIV